MLYPDKETVTAAADDFGALAAASEASAPANAAYWSKRFGKHVGYTEKNILLLVLNREEKYIEVLAEDKKGWIINAKWLKIKEIE